ncbi:MAG TPA: transposase [Dermatophilaceae bacterium]
MNTAWAQLAAISADLIAWLRLLALTPQPAKAEPKALRYRLLHVPARLTTGVRRCRLRIPSNWPWANAIVSAFERIAAIPAPG